MRIIASASAVVAILALALTWPMVPASAKPTDEQLAAIKANCRSDFMSNCWGVPRGGTEAFQCLKDHLASLSAPCQQAVKAVIATATPPSDSGTAQTASKPATESKPAATAAAPATSSPPAGSSAPAGSAFTSAEAPAQGAANAGATTTGSSASAASANAAQGTPAGSSSEKAAAKKSSTVSTVASQGSGATGATTAKTKPLTQQGAETAASAATSAAATPDLGFIPPRKKLIIARFCRDYFTAHCPGVDVGGGRAISCLEANKASLTPDCRDALTKLIR